VLFAEGSGFDSQTQRKAIFLKVLQPGFSSKPDINYPLIYINLHHTKVSAEPMRDWLWSLGDDYVSRESSRTNTGSECSSSSTRRRSLKSSSDINEDIVSEKLVNVLLDNESLLASKPSSDDSNDGSMTDASQSSTTTGRARSSSS
jgi:hypothetical protein